MDVSANSTVVKKNVSIGKESDENPTTRVSTLLKVMMKVAPYFPSK